MLIDGHRRRATRFFLTGSLLLGALAPSCGATGEAPNSSGGEGGDSAGGAGGQTSGTNGQVGCSAAADCDDGDKCTTDACDKGSCVHTQVLVDDKNGCTADACDKALGVVHTLITMDDNNKCTDDACDPASGVVTHTTVAVDDNDPCTDDACDPTKGVTHTPIPVDDKNACTVDACNPLSGISHLPVNIDDNDPCTADSCNPLVGIIHTPVNVDDNNKCTADACDPASGVVTHTMVTIDDNNQCTIDACNPFTGTSHTPVNIDDNNACTIDACDPLTGVSHTPKSCDDNDICTTDSCSPQIGCVHTPTVYFSDDFADDSKGWLLDPTWQIGPATLSSGATFGNPDPTEDHSPTTDNGIAGVFIGGNTVPPGVTPGPFNYLTSPAVDLKNVSGPVILQFFRWLNSDFMPKMKNSVEVFNGTAWVKLWETTDQVNPIIRDNAWTGTGSSDAPTVFDVTPFKNDKFRFRFGYQYNQLGGFVVSGWNLDDVRLVPSATCP